MKRLVLTNFDNLTPYIALVLPKLSIACSNSGGRYTPEDILQHIRDNSMQIWLAFDDEELDGFILTQLLNYPQAKAIRFFCAMGVKIDGWQAFMTEIGGWLPFTKKVEDWGLSMGCVLSQMECPPAWESYIKNLGYKPGHVLFEKELG